MDFNFFSFWWLRDNSSWSSHILNGICYDIRLNSAHTTFLRVFRCQCSKAYPNTNFHLLFLIWDLSSLWTEKDYSSLLFVMPLLNFDFMVLEIRLFLEFVHRLWCLVEEKSIFWIHWIRKFGCFAFFVITSLTVECGFEIMVDY